MCVCVGGGGGGGRGRGSGYPVSLSILPSINSFASPLTLPGNFCLNRDEFLNV